MYDIVLVKFFTKWAHLSHFSHCLSRYDLSNLGHCYKRIGGIARLGIVTNNTGQTLNTRHETGSILKLISVFYLFWNPIFPCCGTACCVPAFAKQGFPGGVVVFRKSHTWQADTLTGWTVSRQEGRELLAVERSRGWMPTTYLLLLWHKCVTTASHFQ